MAINVHVARIQFAAVNATTGVVADKDDFSVPIRSFLTTRHEHRVMVDQDLPHTADRPDLATYLAREAADSYSLVKLAQSLVITSDKEPAVDVHVAYLQLFNVNPLGAVINKNDLSTTIKSMMQSRTEPRVIVDAANANTANNPTIDDYIKAEAASDYAVRHIDQTLIISYK